MSKDHVVRTSTYASALDDPMQAGTRRLSDLFGHRQVQAALDGRCNDRGRDYMMRGLLERGSESQHGLGFFVRRNLEREQSRTADRERTGLVQQYRMSACQRLERSSALDQNPAPRSLGNASDQGHRRRQNERTGGCGYEHGQAADEIAGEKPGDARHGDGERQEEERVTVREPHKGRLGGLRRSDHTHDARIRALARG